MTAATRAGAAAVLLFLFFAELASGGRERIRASLFPKLRAGEAYTYQVRYQEEKKIKTESAVAAPMAPEGGRTDTQRLVRVEVLGERGAGRAAELRLRLRLTPPGEPENEKTAELTLSGDGRVSNRQGMDAFSAEDKETVRAWMAQFGIAGVFPSAGVLPGERWKAEEPVAGAALAGLVWEKQFSYVRNETCPVNSQGAAPEKDGGTPQLCAVILTTETLKQRSSPKHATPEDFRARELRTAGTASGTDEIVSYIALDNGLLVRGTEQAQQAMDVEVALADRGNRVHYNVDARSHTEVLIVAEAAGAARQEARPGVRPQRLPAGTAAGFALRSIMEVSADACGCAGSPSHGIQAAKPLPAAGRPALGHRPVVAGRGSRGQASGSARGHGLGQDLYDGEADRGVQPASGRTGAQ
jgi:hypothetical protein